MEKTFILFAAVMLVLLSCGFAPGEPPDQYIAGMVSVGNCSGETGLITNDPDSLALLQDIVDSISDIPCIEFEENPAGGYAASIYLKRQDGKIDIIEYRAAGDSASVNGVYYKTTKENFHLALDAIEKIKPNKQLTYWAQYKQPKGSKNLILIQSDISADADVFLKAYHDLEPYPDKVDFYRDSALDKPDQIIFYAYDEEGLSSYTITPTIAYKNAEEHQPKSVNKQKYEELREILGANKMPLFSAERLTVTDGNGEETFYNNPIKIEEILKPLNGIKEAPMQNVVFCSEGAYTLSLDGKAQYTVYDSPGLWVYAYDNRTFYYSPERQYTEWLKTLE